MPVTKTYLCAGGCGKKLKRLNVTVGKARCHSCRMKKMREYGKLSYKNKNLST